MKYLEEMIGLAEREFKEMAERGKFRSPDEIHIAYELIDIVKDIVCFCICTGNIWFHTLN